MFLALSLLFALFSCAQKETAPVENIEEEVNLKKVESLIEKVWNEKDLSAIDSLFSNTLIREVNGVNLASNKKELTANLQLYFNGFPDLQINLEEMTTVGNHVYLYWTLSGTHTGIFGELPPTGKKIKIRGISRTDFDDTGKIIRERVFYNELSLLQQMGYTLNPPLLE
jgi:steroid delta-isomerase-like uncharacterized protein